MYLYGVVVMLEGGWWLGETSKAVSCRVQLGGRPKPRAHMLPRLGDAGAGEHSVGVEGLGDYGAELAVDVGEVIE